VNRAAATADSRRSGPAADGARRVSRNEDGPDRGRPGQVAGIRAGRPPSTGSAVPPPTSGPGSPRARLGPTGPEVTAASSPPGGVTAAPAAAPCARTVEDQDRTLAAHDARQGGPPIWAGTCARDDDEGGIARPRASDTGAPMPNTSPPRRTRAATGSTLSHSTSPRPAPSSTGAPARVASVPSSWAGAEALLARVPATSTVAAPLNLAVLAAASARPTVTIDLSGIWCLAAAASPQTSLIDIRTVDDKLRLSLPLTASAVTRVRAERDGAVLTVYLDREGLHGPAEEATPTTTPASVRVVAPLAMGTKGRLTLGKAVCAELGVGAGSQMIVKLDPTGTVLRICAAALLDTAVEDALDRYTATAPVTRGGTRSGHGRQVA
jgi:hypothetical protein